MSEKKNSPFSTYLRLLKFVKPYKKSLAGSVLSTIFCTIFSGASIILTIPMLNTLFNLGGMQVQSVTPATGLVARMKTDAVNAFNTYVFGASKSEALLKICIIIVISFFLKNVFGYLQSYLMAFVEQGFMRDIRNSLYRKLQELSIGYFTNEKTGTLISRITNDVTVINTGISASFVTLIREPLTILVYLSIALSLSWRLTLIAFVVIPFALLFISRIGIILYRESDLSQRRMADITSVLQETISGMKIVRAFGMEDFEIRKFEDHTNKYYKSILKITNIRNLASPVTEFLSVLAGAVIIFYGGMQVLQAGLLSPSVFMTVLIAVFQIMPSAKELTTVSNRIQESAAAGNRIFEVLDEPGKLPEPQGAKVLGDFKKEILFDNVWFSYPQTRIGRAKRIENKYVLKGVSITINKGEVLAIVGPSGGGKSTLIDLIPRFYDPTQGSITIDGFDLRDVKIESLRALIGIVAQETILFNDTVRNNIAYGLTDCPIEKISAAAEAANAHEFITQLQHGYDSVIGERGTKLSGGQRQRISIARALLKNPPIIIFDEATSALDSESEMIVQEAIERLMQNRTSIVIAHRLSTIKNADRIIVIDGGEVVQSGKHQDLVRQRGGIYKKLYEMQFND